MIEGRIEGETVVLNETEFYDRSWYGELKGGKSILGFMEALHLAKDQKIDVLKDSKKLSLKEMLELFSAGDPEFMTKYYVYSDLRERGLIVKPGFKGSDFIVYERGSKSKKGKVEWVVFVDSEDTVAEIHNLERISKIAKNIRCKSVWAVVDNDSDITYYLVSEEEP